MNAGVNRTNRARLDKIRRELFDMANSYAGDEHGHIACRLHGISNSVYNIRDIMEVLYPVGLQTGTPTDPQPNREPEPKPLAQYLDEYIEHEIELGNIRPAVSDLFAYNSWRDLLQQALDAYESTEQVKIRIEKA